MSIPITAILSALGQAGLGDIVTKITAQGNNVDKLKLKFIAILVESMDETGKCEVKEVIKTLMEKEKFFDFDD